MRRNDQQGVHQQRWPYGPQTQWLPGGQCTSRPPQAAGWIGEYGRATTFAPCHVAASVFDAGEAVSRIVAAIAKATVKPRIYCPPGLLSNGQNRTVSA
jgi:hypothetical protein